MNRFRGLVIIAFLALLVSTLFFQHGEAQKGEQGAQSKGSNHAGGQTPISVGPAPSIIVSAGATLVAESCTPANGVLDPNETVTVSLCLQNTGAANTTNLVGTLQATGGVTSPSGPQNYGVVVAGGPAVCRNFTFTANGACGGTVTASLQLQDGATNLGTLTYTFTLGVPSVVFQENFDGVSAPALPAGWVATQGTNATGAPMWVTSNAGTPAPPADTAPNAIFSTDPNDLLDNRIDTPAITISTTGAVLTFRNNFNLESSFDGGVLEISIPSVAAGAFQDILTAGGSFVSGGYTGPIGPGLSPIAGRQAWSGSSSGFITTTVNLPAAAAGQSIKLRFREASDPTIALQGWRVDTIRITDGFTCSTTCVSCAITCPANITVPNAPNQCGAVVTYPAPTTTGNCGTITCTPASGSFFPVGTTTVTCTAAAGPSCSFTVKVNDTQPPAIVCPGSITKFTDSGQLSATVNPGTPVALDSCPLSVVGVRSDGKPLNAPYPVGVTTITWTATDTGGNTASCAQSIAVMVPSGTRRHP